MKSALELALEKADGMLGDEKDDIKLKPEQIQAIDDIKKQYEAKWAEQEIVLKGRLQQLATQVEPQVLAENQGKLQEEMNRVREQIFAERDAKVEAIRQGQS